MVALSSGEADLYVLVKDVAPSHSLASMLNDFGTGVGCIVCTDDSAAIGMVYRQGFGKTRHKEVQFVLVHKDIYDGKLAVGKVDADSNPADLLTNSRPRPRPGT